MMNLEKMKQKKRTITKSRVKKSLLAATIFLCLTTPLLQTQTAYAAENTTPTITIEKPDGWKQGETTIAVNGKHIRGFITPHYAAGGSATPQPSGKKSVDRKSTRLNSSHIPLSRMPSSA